MEAIQQTLPEFSLNKPYQCDYGVIYQLRTDRKSKNKIVYDFVSSAEVTENPYKKELVDDSKICINLTQFQLDDVNKIYRYIREQLAKVFNISHEDPALQTLTKDSKSLLIRLNKKQNKSDYLGVNKSFKLSFDSVFIDNDKKVYCRG